MRAGKIIGITAAVIIIPAVIISAIYFLLPAPGLSAEYFYFAADSASNTQAELTPDELISYRHKYSDAVSDYYFSTLSDSDKAVYNAVAYAADNGYSYILIPEKRIDSAVHMSEIMAALSCDSPFIAHNYTVDGRLTLEPCNKNGAVMLSLELKTLGKEYAKRRQEAYDKAKELVASLPAECDTEIEKSLYLYEYVVRNIDYVTGSYSADNVPIADALLDGVAVCDGYSDTVTLLFNLCGIETASVNGVNRNGNHALNFAFIDGEYYYFDATADSCQPTRDYGVFYYGMSWDTAYSFFTFDSKQSPLIPAAKNTLADDIADMTAENVSEQAAQQAADIIGEKGRVLIYTGDSLDDTQSQQLFRKISSLTVCKKALSANGITLITATG